MAGYTPLAPKTTPLSQEADGAFLVKRIPFIYKRIN